MLQCGAGSWAVARAPRLPCLLGLVLSMRLRCRLSHRCVRPTASLPVRAEALRRALLIGESDRLLFGSDDTEPMSLTKAGEILDFDRRTLTAELGLDERTVRRIMGENLLEFLGMKT